MTLAMGPVPAISHHQMLVFLVQIGVLLTVAVGLGRLAARVGLPSVVGELTAGVVLGPSLLGNLAPDVSNWLLPRNPEQLHLLGAVGQLGVIFLVAITGAHIDLGLLRRKRRAISWVSAGSVLLPLVIGFVLSLLLPDSLMGKASDRLTFGLFMGVAVAVSALPVIAKTLLDMGLLHRNVGQIIIGAAAVSDIIGWLLLSVVSAMATFGFRIGVLTESVGYLILVLVATAYVARPLIGRLLRTVERSAGREVSLSAIAVLIVLSAAGTHALGMEPVLGAFLCGIVVGSLGTESRRSLDSMRAFIMATLAPLFLATAGLQVDLTALAEPQVLVAALITLLVAIGAKFAGGYLGARAGRLAHTESVAIGAGLNARGVVEIILASVGLQLGVLTTASYTIVVLVAVVTSVMAPPILRRTTQRMTKTDAEREREREFMSPSL
ncbi:cation:proton antiporter [Streptomyces pinistramenti]|uniref:cation:proton antiporter n=1 Tax=Streptomyces pinistramenti TaxID=2884812 RepID=UPI001D06C425|nr:cation:proton antiporter [Streptomyces pinistramenti]MCB5906270.1 cation:proton antiporter [Streptomyces pinistramenti]